MISRLPRSSETFELPFHPDSVVFGSHSGWLGTLREVTEDDPSGRFADLLDSVEVCQRIDIMDSEEKNVELAENRYVALDDKVGLIL